MRSTNTVLTCVGLAIQVAAITWSFMCHLSLTWEFQVSGSGMNAAVGESLCMYQASCVSPSLEDRAVSYALEEATSNPNIVVSRKATLSHTKESRIVARSHL